MAITSWICDSCGERITDPHAGTVTWREDGDYKAYDYLVVHKNLDGRSCDPGASAGYVANVDIAGYLGPNGLAALLSHLSLGPIAGKGDIFPRVKDFDGYVDLVRRLQTEGYDAARSRFGDEDVQHWLGDANEYYPYMPEVLERINKRTLG